MTDLINRNGELFRLGITAIWYPEKQYHFVDNMLRLAKSEMNYKRSKVARAQHFMPKTLQGLAPMPDPTDA